MLPQPSQTWQEPAGRILVPQVMQSGESTAEPVRVSRSSALVWAVAGAGLEAEASWLSPETLWVSPALAALVSIRSSFLGATRPAVVASDAEPALDVVSIPSLVPPPLAELAGGAPSSDSTTGVSISSAAVVPPVLIGS